MILLILSVPRTFGPVLVVVPLSGFLFTLLHFHADVVLDFGPLEDVAIELASCMIDLEIMIT